MMRVQVQLSEAQLRALREAAAREEASIAEMVRRAIDRWLAASDAPSPDDRVRVALNAPSFRTGVPDLAERHDHYLAEGDDGR